MSLTVTARAKINLTLDILGRRDDGYHEVSMVMQSVALCDDLEFEPYHKLELTCTNPAIPTDMHNDILRAAYLLQSETRTFHGAHITLRKKIPMAAGLAGGSSDGAAALLALNQLWRLGLTHERLLELAAQLGSDMPFCLTGGTAWATGRGEQLSPLPSIPELHFVLMKPDFGVSTRDVYGRLRLGEQSSLATPGMIEAIKTGDRQKIIDSLSNHLQPITCGMYPVLRERQQLAMHLGALNCIMSGSGPTLIAIVADTQQAEKLSQRLAAPHWWVCATSSSPYGLTIA